MSESLNKIEANLDKTREPEEANKTKLNWMKISEWQEKYFSQSPLPFHNIYIEALSHPIVAVCVHIISIQIQFSWRTSFEFKVGIGPVDTEWRRYKL